MDVLYTFIPHPMKSDLKQCANYRTIALVSHASKILLWIIQETIQVKIKTEIADKQSVFRQRRGTRDQITNLRILMQEPASTSNHSICALWTSKRHLTLSPMKSCG